MTNEEIREFGERIKDRKPDYEIDGWKYRKFDKKLEAQIFMIITDGIISDINNEYIVRWK